MPHKREGNLIFFRFEDGKDVFEGLDELIRGYNIRSGVVLCGVGMLRNSQVGFYSGGAEGYILDDYDEPVELLSLSGNVSLRGNKPFSHLHVSLRKKNKSVVGGHLTKATVHNTLEGAIIKLIELKLVRNSETGVLSVE